MVGIKSLFKKKEPTNEKDRRKSVAFIASPRSNSPIAHNSSETTTTTTSSSSELSTTQQLQQHGKTPRSNTIAHSSSSSTSNHHTSSATIGDVNTSSVASSTSSSPNRATNNRRRHQKRRKSIFDFFKRKDSQMDDDSESDDDLNSSSFDEQQQHNNTRGGSGGTASKSHGVFMGGVTSMGKLDLSGVSKSQPFGLNATANTAINGEQVLDGDDNSADPHHERTISEERVALRRKSGRKSYTLAMDVQNMAMNGDEDARLLLKFYKDAYTRETQIQKNKDFGKFVEDLKNIERKRGNSLFSGASNDKELLSNIVNNSTPTVQEEETMNNSHTASTTDESTHEDIDTMTYESTNNTSHQHSHSTDSASVTDSNNSPVPGLLVPGFSDSQMSLYQKLKAKTEQEEKEREEEHQKEIEERLRKKKELEEKMRMLMDESDSDMDSTRSKKSARDQSNQQQQQSDSALMLQQRKLEQEAALKREQEQAEFEKAEQVKKQKELERIEEEHRLERERLEEAKKKEVEEKIRLQRLQEEEEERRAKQELDDEKERLSQQFAMLMTEMNVSGKLGEWIKSVESKMSLVSMFKTELKQAKDLNHNQSSKRTEFNSSLNFLIEKQKDPEKFLQPYEIELMKERIKNIYPIYLPTSEVEKMDEQIKQIEVTEKKKREEAQLRLEQEAAEKLRKEKERQQMIILQRLIKDGNVRVICEELKKNNPMLKAVNLQNKNISNEDVEELSSAILENTCLQELDLSFNTRIDDESVDSIVKIVKQNHTLRKLYLEDTFIQTNQPIIEAVAANFKLVDMVLSEFATDDQLDQLDIYLDRNEGL